MGCLSRIRLTFCCLVGKINTQSGFCDPTFNQCFGKRWSLVSIFRIKIFQTTTLEANAELKINLNSQKDLNVVLKRTLSEKKDTVFPPYTRKQTHLAPLHQVKVKAVFTDKSESNCLKHPTSVFA